MSLALDDDTIAALATPAGRGGIGIIRISGPLCAELARELTGTIPAPRQAQLHSFTDPSGDIIDEGLVLYFRAPHSFTGEDVLELQGHGGPIVLDRLLEALLQLGVRLARPGEFSERAFLNGKLDLAQAEAIADLIDSGSRDAARGALRTLQGEFSRRIQELVDSLTELRCYVEASIDFPEEEIDFLADQQLVKGIKTLQQQLADVEHQAQQGCVLSEGLNVVIAGPPNAGKSSLMNRLAGEDRAIVTPVAGTTRDLLREQIAIDGLPVHIIDTAGLRDSPDEVESEGIRRARQSISEADLVLLILDSQQLEDESIALMVSTHLSDLGCELPPVTVVLNKADLGNRPVASSRNSGYPVITLSALNGDGIELLRLHLKDRAGYSQPGTGSFSARRRHLDALRRASDAVHAGATQLASHAAGELLAEDLRLAQQALGEITGEVSPDDLLGAIFSSFCIGK